MENTIVIDGNKMSLVNAKEWLNNNYPTKEKRANQKSLIFLGRYVRTISTDKQHLGIGFEQVTLQEELDLNDFVSLEILVINGQLINKLKIDCCLKLKFLVINSTDLLSEIDISKNSKLIAFDCTDNKNLGSPVSQLSEKKDEEIKELRKMLDRSKEETINYKIQSKEGKLENFIREIGVDRMQIRNIKLTFLI